MNETRTYAVQVEVSLENADILIPVMKKNLIDELHYGIHKAQGWPAGKPSVRVTDEIMTDPETGDILQFKRVTALCEYFVEAFYE
jgi:hypothetical protein